VTLRQDLFALFDPLITETVIWQDGNAPRPALPYVAMKVMGMRRVNQDHYSEKLDDDGMQAVKGDREFTLNVQRFGSSSVESLDDLANRLRLETIRNRFFTAKLPLISADDVVDVAALLDKSQIEPRASLDVFIRLKSELLDNVGYIETVVITATDDSDAPPYVVTVTAP
jgi:hypothetical protein